ncbi:MAG TPA: HD domain-containing protein [Isosphaeraceae bacterium]|nr:HD domain-containing protein [Isosphaeraceae bacterium]
MKFEQNLIRLIETQGDAAYFGEAVSQKEHALQAAWLAEQEGAPDALIVAALLHDVGHLRHGQGEDVADRGEDAHHESAGADWLAGHFGPEVVEPVRLHVAAKRYLCSVDLAYRNGLSPASLQSLTLQGGAFSDDERREFECHPFARDAVRLRRWDDAAKVPGLDVPPLTHYLPRVGRLRNGGLT